MQVKDFLTVVLPAAVAPAIVLAPGSMVPTGAPTPPLVLGPASPQVPASVAKPPHSELETKLDQGIESILQTLDKSQIVLIEQALVGTLSVPSVHDRRVLAACRTALGRDLGMDEKKLMRVRFIERIRELAK